MINYCSNALLTPFNFTDFNKRKICDNFNFYGRPSLLFELYSLLRIPPRSGLEKITVSFWSGTLSNQRDGKLLLVKVYNFFRKRFIRNGYLKLRSIYYGNKNLFSKGLEYLDEFRLGITWINYTFFLNRIQDRSWTLYNFSGYK